MSQEPNTIIVSDKDNDSNNPSMGEKQIPMENFGAIDTFDIMKEKDSLINKKLLKVTIEGTNISTKTFIIDSVEYKDHMFHITSKDNKDEEHLTITNTMDLTTMKGLTINNIDETDTLTTIVYRLSDYSDTTMSAVLDA